ncbi:hypothetical protein B0T17DRAFT_535555 [Bombardia bombarda]|uniref:Uncharacterized protein n=1 Tax=Bombardia bombarda TaxID=252184 RepID=A0AA39WUT2_9PEZI|nr:hypothetical protein B0T17DRAFT_535555 [Bombardia bombarda]
MSDLRLASYLLTVTTVSAPLSLQHCATDKRLSSIVPSYVRRIVYSITPACPVALSCSASTSKSLGQHFCGLGYQNGGC